MVDWRWVDLPQARPIRILSRNFYIKVELGKKKLSVSFWSQKLRHVTLRNCFSQCEGSQATVREGATHSSGLERWSPGCTRSQFPNLLSGCTNALSALTLDF